MIRAYNTRFITILSNAFSSGAITDSERKSYLKEWMNAASSGNRLEMAAVLGEMMPLLPMAYEKVVSNLITAVTEGTANV